MRTINKPKSATGHRVNNKNRFKSLHNSGRFPQGPYNNGNGPITNS